MKIIINTIPHAEQRYPTVGDWQFYPEYDELFITMSDMGDWRKEALVAWHELKEALLCRARGITTAQVDAFDLAWQGDADSEPGEHPDAPYHHEHMSAYASEIALALELGVNWIEYVEAVEEL